MDWELLYKDFHQKYEGTFCYIKLQGKEPELCLIKEIEHTGNAPAIHIFSEQVGDILLKYDTSYSDIEFRYPQVGLFEYKKQAFYVHKLYNRQWKKGPGFQTLKITNLYSLFGAQSPKINIEIMKAALDSREPISIEKGLSKLKDEEYLSIPLTFEFALGLSPINQKSPIIWYMSNAIGWLDEQHNKIVLEEPIFHQELLDYLSRNKTKYEISI